MIPKKHIILYNKHLLSFLRSEISSSVVVISCVASFVATVVIPEACVVSGVSCVSFDLCIVVIGGGVVGVVIAVSRVAVGSVFTDAVSDGIDSVVVVFVTTQYIDYN